MANKYLDLTGLTYLLDKFKAWVTGEAVANKTASIPFGQLDSTSTSTVMTAQVDGITELRDGVCVYLRNGVVTSASGFTLNINELGAKPVYQTLAAATAITTLFNVNYTMLFVYNSTRVAGGCWDMFYGYNSDNNTLAYQIRNYQSNLVMKSALYRYMFVFTAPDGTLVPSCNTSNSTSTSKTLSSTPFNPFAPIYYYTTTTTISAGESPSASNMYIKYYATNMRYGFNVSSTQLTNKAPVYIRCTPQSDGSAVLDGGDCVVQALPSSDDGKIYIYLGQTYSQYQVDMPAEHPVYYYKNGAIRLWTNGATDATTVNGHTVNSDVPANAVFTDTVTTVSTTGDGNAITSISASDGMLTATKGSTFLTAHQDISGKADKATTVNSVTYDSTNKKITKTINGATSDVVSVATLKTDLGIPADAVFTDTVTTVSTSGNGNAVTAVSAENGALTVTKGTTFLTTHQDISGKADKSNTVSSIAYDSSDKKITKTVNGTTTDVVSVATLKTDLGIPSDAVYTDTVTTVTVTGDGNAITSISASNGAVTANKGSTFLTSHQDISGKMDIPSGGTAGQVLTKTENGYEWEDPITLGASVAGEVITFANVTPSGDGGGGGVTIEQVQDLIDQAIAGITDGDEVSY